MNANCKCIRVVNGGYSASKGRILFLIVAESLITHCTNDSFSTKRTCPPYTEAIIVSISRLNGLLANFTTSRY